MDTADLALFAGDFGKTGCTAGCDSDLEPDGDVDGMDLHRFLDDFGRTDCP
ncbi:MAG: hypothetical protein JRJ35_16765 [Deltaproteobacteria bacterium]|nr:hypothetical protein [Deltaproteobacteria bacterium]MBW1950404.1 hypothetical protein [Deltaproteobacteria bacterium]MBW2009254.1 hypothetical protein [Deltaproteobacteria bacterium]MBW2102345.1 hypothetical protein [Deltaproteobacteria bacterium]